MEKEFKSLKLYEDEIMTLLSLPDEQRGKILTALLSERVGQQLPKLDAMETAVYTLVLGQINRAEELSKKRRQNINTRWKDTKAETDDTKDIQNDTNVIQNDTNVIQNDTNVIQNDTNVIQTSYKDDTNAYTNTNTNTTTNTTTKTKTNTKTNTPSSAADAAGTGAGDNSIIEKSFERFWSAYPKKTARQNAFKVWEKLKPDEELTSAVLSALERFKKTEQWQREEGRYIPYPATWLNDRRWEDNISVPSAAPQSSYNFNKSFDIDEIMQQIRDGYRNPE